MKIAFFDCFSGASGDMFVGALLDAGLPIERLDQELQKLAVSGFGLRAKKVQKGALSGTKFDVDVDERHVHRRLRDMLQIVNQSRLCEGVKAKCSDIFEHLARAEASIHDCDVHDVRFHELGNLDSIIDVIASVTALELLGVQTAYCSRIHIGTGFVSCRHGDLPVPAPATLELLKGLPVYSRGIEGELVTPTGAALLRNLCTGFGPMPAMRIESIGYGAGSRDLGIPNMLRVCIGEALADEQDQDQLTLITPDVHMITKE
ncbi:MAG: nickel pincer cofactor biosynthesis protein LarC [Candidatus Coatesbacteria bacterium]|nr:nickel pincer cofactor biosynthesis protein LarC [Candidatus Coatesbacteria bacterium]